MTGNEMSLFNLRSIEMKPHWPDVTRPPKLKVRVTLLDGTQQTYIGLETGRKISKSETDGVVKYDIEFVDFVPGAWEQS